MLIIRFLKAAFLLVSFSVSSAELLIIDEGRYINFIVVGEPEDRLPISKSSFNLNFGLQVNISSDEEVFKLNGADYGFISTNEFYLTDSVVVGRRLPKMMISSMYGLKRPGEYIFDVKFCLTKDHCLLENNRRIDFRVENFPIRMN
jgi:hypothetical protein